MILAASSAVSPDQDRGGLRLDVIELLVESGRRDAQAVLRSVIGGVNRTASPGSDRQHHRNDLREEQLLDVLSLPGDLEDLIESFREEQSLQGRPNHDSRGATFDEPIEYRSRQHPCRLHRGSYARSFAETCYTTYGTP